MLERTVLGILTALLSINVWTGFPIFALWVGSKFVGDSGLSMLAVGIVLLVLVGLMVVGLAALTWLNERYNRLTGRRPAPRQHTPWLRSLSSERLEPARRSRGTTAIERIVVITVVTAVIVFEVWFFFFAGSSLPNTS